MAEYNAGGDGGTPVFFAERIEGGHILAQSPPFPSLAEAIRWAVASGDGHYIAGKESPWGGPEVDGCERFTVSGGAIALPDRTDWARLVHGSGIARRSGRVIPNRMTLWVIKPGDLSAQGLFRDPGTCLARSVRCGDAVLDVLTLEIDEEAIHVKSERQAEYGYRWTPDGPRFDRERRGYTRVSIAGRASSWGTLGDDTYDPGTADAILSEMLVEAVLGTGEWRIAPISYETEEKEARREDDGRSPFEPIATVPMGRFRLADAPKYLTEGVVAASLAEDRRPLELLGPAEGVDLA